MTRPLIIRLCSALAFLLVGATAAAARNEAAVGQCGLTFVGVGDSCERAYGGAGGDPPDGEKLDGCWKKATSEYNACMDKALAAPAASLGTISPTKPPKLSNPVIRGGSTDAVTTKP